MSRAFIFGYTYISIPSLKFGSFLSTYFLPTMKPAAAPSAKRTAKAAMTLFLADFFILQVYLKMNSSPGWET